MASKVFISYRREDSRYQARRVYDAFKRAFPPDSIFMDVASIPPGADFVAILEGWVDQCEVMLALIGPGWINSIDPRTKARRLDNPEDFVRIEIGGGLKRGITIIPVLLDAARMPDAAELPDDIKALRRLNAEFVDFRTFDADVERLIATLGAIKSAGKSDGAAAAEAVRDPPKDLPKPDIPPEPAKQTSDNVNLKRMAMALAAVVGAGLIYAMVPRNDSATVRANSPAHDIAMASAPREPEARADASPPPQVSRPSPSRTPLGTVGSSSRWAIGGAANCGVTKKAYELELGSGTMTWTKGDGSKDIEAINSSSEDEVRTTTRSSDHVDGNNERPGQPWTYSREGDRVRVQPGGRGAFTLSRCS